MREGKLFVAGKDEQSFLAFQSLLNRHGDVLDLSNIVFTHTLSEIRDNNTVIMLCGYDCSTDLCGRCFQLLGKKPLIPFALFRRMFVNHGEHGGYYSLQTVGGSNSLNGLGGLSSLLMISPYRVGPQDDSFSPYAPFGKVATTQRAINAREGVDVTRASLARMAEWHASHLSYAFKKYVGMPLDEYIMKIKYCAALRKVVATGKQIKQIAYEAGYADPLYFGKAFKRRFGISPDVLRGNHSALDRT